MCGPVQEQKEKKIEEIKHESIRETLTGLQTWDLAEGQSLEERRQAYQESMIRAPLMENTAMREAAQLRLAQANAAAAAPGAPVQEQAPAKLTFKQRMEQNRKAKEARKHCPVGTADTYDIYMGVSQVVQRTGNSIQPIIEEATEKRVDLRVLRVFCEGYNQDKRGRPATREDQRAAAADQAFLTDYLSKDVERRRPHLERFRKELLDFPLSSDTVSDANIIKNAARLKQIADRACYYENIMTDPINKPYLDSLDPMERKILDARLADLAVIGSYIIQRMAAIGVDPNSGEYYDNAEGPANFAGFAEQTRPDAVRLSAGWEQKKLGIMMEHEAATQREQMLAGIAEDRLNQRDNLPEDMNFSGPAAGYATDELKRYRSMIEEHPDVYAANKPMLDRLYQELYRGLDILNGLSMDSMVYQAVQGLHYDSPIGGLAFKKLEDLMHSMDAARNRLNAVSQALDSYLRGKTLSDAAQALLTNMGVTEEEIARLKDNHAV